MQVKMLTRPWCKERTFTKQTLACWMIKRLFVALNKLATCLYYVSCPFCCLIWFLGSTLKLILKEFVTRHFSLLTLRSAFCCCILSMLLVDQNGVCVLFFCSVHLRHSLRLGDFYFGLRTEDLPQLCPSLCVACAVQKALMPLGACWSHLLLVWSWLSCKEFWYCSWSACRLCPGGCLDRTSASTILWCIFSFMLQSSAP